MIASADSVAASPGSADRRVLVLSDSLPERNGVGTYYRDLVDHLDGHVGQVALVCPDEEAGWRGRLSFPMPGDPTQAICVPPLRRLSRFVRQLDPDVVISATPGPFGLLGLYLAHRHQATLICGFHTHLEGLTDLYWQAGKGRLFGGFSRWFLNTAHRVMFSRSRAVIANSPEMADMARGLGARHVELVGTPVPRGFLEEPVSASDGALRKVLFAGRLAPEKNIGQVIEAAERHPNVEFVVAGDGPLRDEVAEAHDRLANLNWLGWQPRERMLGLIDGADLLVLPSTVESFGTIALEAMARARMTLVSSACGILGWPELTRGLFAMGKEESVAAALDRLLGMTPEERRQVALAGRQAALELAQANTRGWLHLMAPG